MNLIDNFFQHNSSRGLFARLLVWWVITASASTAWAQIDQQREWSDSTGKFKIIGSLVEVQDGTAFIKTVDGKTLKIPVSRLSKKDQELLDSSASPFEVVDSGSTRPSGAETASRVAVSNPAGTASGGFDWSVPKKVDWDEVEQFIPQAGVPWKVPLPESAKLNFEAKRTALSKKASFHEHMHPLSVNAHCKRAVVGYTVSFAVPKPQSRLTLVDLLAGKAVHAESVEGNMRPLALLDGGSAVLMVGASDERGGYETADQLQVWTFNGKKLVRSATWVPYMLDKEDWGKQKNALVVYSEPVSDDRVLMCSDKGHVVLWQIESRKPIWHARLGNNFALAMSLDRDLLALFDDKTLMILKTQTAEILGSISLDQNTHVGWPRLAWSPSGKRLLFTSVNDVRVLDVEKSEWLMHFNLPGGPVAPNALSYPDDDFAMLDNRLLVHLPTKIQVCEYRDAAQIRTLGGVAFIGVNADAGGILVPATFPHPTAAKLLAKAQSDPSLFLVHPGVSVAIDLSGVSDQYQQTVREGLEKAVASSGYKLARSAPITVVASITGPKQEAVSYIASGAYVVDTFTSTIKLHWNNKDLWSTSGTNVPGVLMTKRGQTIEEALAGAGKQPNTAIFGQARFPEFVQKPSDEQQAGRSSSALMVSKFTVQGLIDAK